MERRESIWKNYIEKVIKSNNIDDEYVNWGVEAIWEIYSTPEFRITPDEIFRSLIYLNKNNILGCFAFTFTDKVLDAIETRNIRDLYSALKSESPEFNNSILTKEEINNIKEEIEREKIILNRYMEGSTSHNNQNEIHYEYHKKCVNDICIASKINPNIINKGEHCPIRVTDHGISFSYNLSELLTRVYLDDVNSYTNEKFSEGLKTLLLEQYPTLFKFIKIYQEKLV